jgi:hypothetical protein
MPYLGHEAHPDTDREIGFPGKTGCKCFLWDDADGLKNIMDCFGK